MIEEQYDLFKVKNKTWRMVTERFPTDPSGNTVLMSIATVDDKFTADSKVLIEYYSDHFTLNPHASRQEYTREAIAFVTAILDNDDEFREPEHWRVKQVIKSKRLVMNRFVGIPLPFFWKLWRRPLIPANINIELADSTSAQVSFSYFEETDPLMSMKFDCYLDWNGLFDDLKYGSNRPIIPWIQKHLTGHLYLFSDFDTIFENPEDEVRYLVDFEL